jgi:hypothetical protein
MSGGFIEPQQDGDHQVVIFTFAGQIDQQDVDQWNNDISNLKQVFGPRLMGVTIKGESTPVQFMRRQQR